MVGILQPHLTYSKFRMHLLLDNKKGILLAHTNFPFLDVDLCTKGE